MGAPKQKWTAEEEEALRAGVEKHGAGKWRTIQKDPEFRHLLSARSNIDLKDKWRNISVGDKFRSHRSITSAPAPPPPKFILNSSSASKPSSSPLLLPSSSPSSSSSSTLPQLAPSSSAPASASDSKPTSAPITTSSARPTLAPPSGQAMVIEALSALQNPNGSEIGAICRYIELKYSVPPNFRRLLSSKLRRLVLLDKIEKVQNLYRLKESTFATKTPTSKPKDSVRRPKPPQKFGAYAVKEVAISAAYRIAEAEAKSFLASEAVKEAERIARMAEETESVLLFAIEIFAQRDRGEIISVA